MRAVRPLLLVVALLGAAAGGSCNTPTLPIPPPITESLVSGSTPGTVVVSVTQEHALDEASYLLVFNQMPAHGVPAARRIVGPNAFEVEIPAERGDCLLAFFLLDLGEIGQGTTCLPWP